MVSGSTPESAGICAPVTIPDPAGLSPLEFKLALAAGGCYLLPTGPDLARMKNPGSIAKKSWQFKSSRNPDLIRQWHEADPDAGIAIHTGRSGLVASDIDVDEIPDELGWLRSGLFQSSRGLLLDAGINTARGHYVFASDTVFVSGPIKLADGTQVGEVRSGNTIICSQPSRHSKRDSDGGEYRWITTGVVPTVPESAVALGYLRVHTGMTQRNGEQRCSTTDYVEYLADRESSAEELSEWALAQFNEGSAEACCPAIRRAKDKWVSAVKTEDASYPNLALGIWEILNLAAEGHTGWDAARGKLEIAYYVEVVEIRRKRLDFVVLAEIDRAYIDALRKIKAAVDQAAAIGALYTPAECLCIRRKKNPYGYRSAYQPAYRPAYQLKWNH